MINYRPENGYVRKNKTHYARMKFNFIILKNRMVWCGFVLPLKRFARTDKPTKSTSGQALTF